MREDKFGNLLMELSIDIEHSEKIAMIKWIKKLFKPPIDKTELDFILNISSIEITIRSDISGSILCSMRHSSHSSFLNTHKIIYPA